MIGINIALELLHAVRREALGELAQGPKATRVPIPNIISVAMVGAITLIAEPSDD